MFPLPQKIYKSLQDYIETSDTIVEQATAVAERVETVDLLDPRSVSGIIGDTIDLLSTDVVRQALREEGSKSFEESLSDILRLFRVLNSPDSGTRFVFPDCSASEIAQSMREQISEDSGGITRAGLDLLSALATAPYVAEMYPKKSLFGNLPWGEAHFRKRRMWNAHAITELQL